LFLAYYNIKGNIGEDVLAIPSENVLTNLIFGDWILRAVHNTSCLDMMAVDVCGAVAWT
jgi:hypothetical protein